MLLVAGEGGGGGLGGLSLAGEVPGARRVGNSRSGSVIFVSTVKQLGRVFKVAEIIC